MSYRNALVGVLLAVAGCGATDHTGRPGVGGGGADGGGGGGGQDMGGGGGGGGGDGGGACSATNVTAASVKLPVDIIWIIDNSGSMDEEEGYVQTNVNTFAQNIATSGIDYHVIMIADTTHINVPPPLGGSPQFLAVNQFVNSNDALVLLNSTYPMWQNFLRPNALKHIVVVSDDESTQMSAASFTTMMTAKIGTFVLHAIVAESQGISIGFPPVTDHCFNKAAAVGKQYLDLQKATGGVFASLCDTNWAPVFTALAAAVVKGTALPCNFAIPPPPAGETLDFSAVNLVYTPTGGAGTTVPMVSGVAACTASGGWYYDNAAAPTQLIACPATCSTFTADSTGQVAVAFGCKTVIQ
ncbi:MAG TPA: vWA domain-containing protein [Kofleriaceae bacterium]|nr:vWA domain-containing protein [Kofleriaceae bacterium]